MRALLLLIVLATTGTLGTPVEAQPFSADLIPADGGVSSEASGRAVLRVVQDGTIPKVALEGGFEGLGSSYRSAHLYVRNERGDKEIAAELDTDLQSGERAGSWDGTGPYSISQAHLDSLRAGRLFLDVHSDAYSGDLGEVEGRFTPFSIAEVRALPLDEVASATGVVTRSEGRITFLQDDTGGIAVFTFENTPFGEARTRGEVRPGTRVRVRGRLYEFGQLNSPPGDRGTGFLEITDPQVNIDYLEYEVLGQGAEPPPAQGVTVADVKATSNGCDSEDFQSEVVRVNGLTLQGASGLSFEANRSYTVSDATGTMTLRTPPGSDTTIEGTPLPEGPFTFEGVVNRFRCETQLYPIEAGDVFVPDATPTERGPEAQAQVSGAYPNPSRSSVALQVRAEAPADVDVVLYDLAGRAVYRAASTSVRPGAPQAVEIAVDGLPAGLYWARVTVQTPSAEAAYVRSVVVAR